MHAYEMHAHEMYPREMHAREMYAYKTHAYEMHVCEVHAYEGFCEDLARQTTVTHLTQLQLGFRRCRIWVSVTVMAS
jgi:hypothetical protein